MGFGLVEMAISTNPKPMIYCNLVREYGARDGTPELKTSVPDYSHPIEDLKKQEEKKLL